jgi:hypothetical protein
VDRAVLVDPADQVVDRGVALVDPADRVGVHREKS